MCCTCIVDANLNARQAFVQEYFYTQFFIFLFFNIAHMCMYAVGKICVEAEK